MAALQHLQFLLGDHGTGDVICWSHSASNVAGTLLVETCLLAAKAADSWSALLVASGECRRLFRVLSGVTGETKNTVRWYAWFTVVRQIRLFPKIIRQLADNAELGCDKLRAKLARAMDKEGLRLETALVDDAASPLVCFFYEMEGDGFLAPICYDLRTAVVEHEKRTTGRFNPLGPPLKPVCPLLEAEILKGLPLPADQARRDALLIEVASKAHLMFDKVNDDTRVGGRLFGQSQLMRAARLFNFVETSKHGIPALTTEIETYIPVLDRTRHDLVQLLVTDLKAYHTACVVEVAALDRDAAGLPVKQTPENLWAFWNRNAMNLPVWYRAAKGVAIILTSSGCAERVFALYTSVADVSQESALEDRVESSVMLKFNNKQREMLDA